MATTVEILIKHYFILLCLVVRAGWVAMLVMAIVIIVQAPRCTPKETLHWVQESGMIQYDLNNPVDGNGDGVEENPKGELEKRNRIFYSMLP